ADAALLDVAAASGTQRVNWVAGPRDLSIHGTGLTGAGGGGGGAVTIADGASATFGAEADAASAGDTTTTTYMALFKRLLQRVTTWLGLFPAAAALSEGAANPTASGLAGFGMVWNGATWDRLRSPAGDAAPVTGMLSAAVMGFNGSGYDRARVDNTA